MGLELVCFFRPNGANGYLSNWYDSPFILEGQKYICAEQYLMWAKAQIFGDHYMANQILKAVDPYLMKKYGRQVQGFNEDIWRGYREQVMHRALLGKFMQNPRLRVQLMETGNALLVECSPYDRVWGIGLSMTNPDRLSPELWRGQNLLGKQLAIVRTELCTCR